jgi:putative ABC transport system substrate-binding protein
MGIMLFALFAVPLVADAQPPSVPRVGVLSPGKLAPDDAFRQREHFEAGLRELGWTPGSNIVIDYRYADGILDRLPALAAELVRLPVNVARGLTIRAAREATATIPIVMARPGSGAWRIRREFGPTRRKHHWAFHART